MRQRLRSRRRATPCIMAASAPAVFDPATLSPTEWLKTSYSASPWVATTGDNATEATNPPAISGSSLGGLDSPDFTSPDTLAISTYDNYIGSGVFSGYALVYLDTIIADTGNHWTNDGIVNTAGSGYFGATCHNTSVDIVCWRTTGEDKVSATIAAAGWTLVQWRLIDGDVREARVNNGPWSSISSVGTLASLALTLKLGNNRDGPLYDGQIRELFLCDQDITRAQFDSVRSYVNSTYSLSI